MASGQVYNAIPKGWQPYQSRKPISVIAREDQQVHLVANPTTGPGYAYGTLIPLDVPKVGMRLGKFPNLMPKGKTFSNVVRMKPQLQGVQPYTPFANVQMGTLNQVPAPAYTPTQINEVQAYINSLRR